MAKKKEEVKTEELKSQDLLEDVKTEEVKEEKEEVKEEKKTSFVKIKIKSDVYLNEDMKVYSSKKGNKLYKKSDDIIEVHEDYKERLSKFPLHIEIL